MNSSETNDLTVAINHARDMVEGHYPNHREYIVAKALLDVLGWPLRNAVIETANSKGKT